MTWRHVSSCFTSQQPCSAPEEPPAWLVSPSSSVSQSLPGIHLGHGTGRRWRIRAAGNRFCSAWLSLQLAFGDPVCYSLSF